MRKIIFFQRKRRPGANYSIEQIFDDLALRLNKKYKTQQTIVPYISSGLFKRIGNIFYAAFHQGDVNHITGDINYVALFLRKRKTISTILDLGILERTNGLKRKIILTIWFSLPVKRSKWVTVISEATKTDLLKNVNCDPKKIKVIHVPISSLFKFKQKTFEQHKPTILQIGGAPNKNLSGLIKAVKGIQCRLLIIGKISDSNLKALEDANIKFDNKVGIPFNEVINSYENADMLFFASTFEGFGMPILEAQAVGRPVITSNILSMPEVGGDGALYVDPFDDQDIKKGIIELIENKSLRESLVEKGKENVKRFDPDLIQKKYEELYEEILSN